MKCSVFVVTGLAALLLPATSQAADGQRLPPGLALNPGALNSVLIDVGEGAVIVYGCPGAEADLLLLTHARRDLVEFALGSLTPGCEVVAPRHDEALALLRSPETHWSAWWQTRFDYYQQQVTRLPTRPLRVDREVGDGERIEGPGGFAADVLSTPGYTREGISYLVEIDGKRVAFTGDLILADGKVPDLYSFQEAIPEAKIGGYHGYGGRLAQLVGSLQKLAAAEPDIIVPLRGDAIFDPGEAIEELIRRVREIYSNYLSTNALNWYFKEERLTTAGRRVLGDDAEIELMDYSEHVDLPDWCRHLGTTKLLLAGDGSGAAFALDVGGQRALDDLKALLAEGLISAVEGIFVTHTHNDHTAAVGEAAREFGCPVYAIDLVAEVLERPGDWFLPGISPNVVDEVTVMKDGEAMAWRDFRFTAQFFPGQMLNHGALLVERDDHAPVLFMGDSFSPSGIDDYCLMNRNLMREDTGYFLCFEKVRALPQGAWMVNQHIPHLFRFTEQRLDLLEARYAERRDLIAELTPWDDPNFAIDERWASFHPYGQTLPVGRDAMLELRLWNHSPRDREFRVRLNLPNGLSAENDVASVTIAAREEREAIFRIHVDATASPGVHVITADLASDDFNLAHWAEALVKVE